MISMNISIRFCQKGILPLFFHRWNQRILELLTVWTLCKKLFLWTITNLIWIQQKIRKSKWIINLIQDSRQWIIIVLPNRVLNLHSCPLLTMLCPYWFINLFPNSIQITKLSSQRWWFTAQDSLFLIHPWYGVYFKFFLPLFPLF